MKKSKNELQHLLNSLSSEEGKIKFLVSIYQPGYGAVLELLEELSSLNLNIIEKEVEFSSQQNKKDSLIKYGKMLIKIYIEEELMYLLPGKIKKLGNEELKMHLLDQLPFSQSREHLLQAANVYEEFGIHNRKRTQVEEKLSILEINDKQFPYIGSNRLVKQGKYHEAIDHNLKFKKPYCLADAWKLASEHVPQRKPEVAWRIWERGIFGENAVSETLYLAAGKELGRSSEIVKDFQKLVVVMLSEEPNSPRFYRDIIQVLKELNLKSEMEQILQKAEDYIVGKDYPADPYKEMANLYEILDDKFKLRYWYGKLIDYQARECHPSHALGSVDSYIDLTGDVSIKKLLFPLYEKQRAYSEAIKLAEELSMPEKVSAYQQIADLLPAKEKVDA